MNVVVYLNCFYNSMRTAYGVLDDSFSTYRPKVSQL